MALEIQQITLSPNEVLPCTFSDIPANYAIGLTGFAFYPAGGDNAVVQILANSFSVSQSGKTLNITWTPQLGPDSLDGTSSVQIAVLVFFSADTTLNSLSTWTGVPNGQPSPGVQTVASPLNIQQAFISGFHYSQSDANYVNTISASGTVEINGSNATITPQLLLQDASGHVANATMDAVFLQSADHNPSFAVQVGTLTPEFPTVINFDPSITEVFVMATSFDVSFGSGNDFPITAFTMATTLIKGEGGVWVVEGRTGMQGHTSSRGELCEGPVGFVAIGLTSGKAHAEIPAHAE